MLKNMSYKDKFALLKKWMPEIINSIKKDLKNEHLKKDWGFVKQYFTGKNLNKLTADEIAQAYIHVIENGENAEQVAEFISNRWLLKNTELYQLFEQELSKINPNFNELEEIENHRALEMISKAVNEFGALKTYLFSILNSVVFSQEVYNILAAQADADIRQAELDEQAHTEMKSLQDMQRSHDQQIARLTDKYEKKLLGLQKKYSVDIEALKKQIVSLQRKLNHQPGS